MFVDGTVDTRTLLDAQMMYDIRKWNYLIKLGRANVLGNECESAPGVRVIDSQIYGS